MKQNIIGLAGTNGSGKDTVGHILADTYGYLFVSVTDLLRREVERRGLEVTRANLRGVGNEWRRELGPGVLIDKAMADYKAAGGTYKGLAVSSLRNPGEADRLHDLGGTVLWIDADPHVRYERIQANAAKRGRAGEDEKTFEQFLAEEQTEMNQSGDAATLDMSAVKAKSDLTLVNDTKDLDAFRTLVESQLGLAA